MEEKNNLELKSSKKKITLIIVLIVLVAALVVLAVINPANNKKGDNIAPVSTEVSETPVVSGETGSTATAPTGEENMTASEDQDKTPKKTEAPIEKTNPITVKLSVDSDKGFSPASIDVKAGQQITLSITATGGVAIVVFDSGLSASAVGVSNSQTKDVTFNAPTVRGEYSFHNDIPGKSQIGKIIVK